MCPHLARELKSNPGLLAEAANFAVVAGEYHLVSSQALDTVAQGVNKLVGTNFSYEGARQTARDIQVFQKLNSDSFSGSGVFKSAQSAKEYFRNATEGQLDYLNKRLAGTGQEIDWQNWKNGKLSALWEKASLPDGNAVGYDGEVVNRFTGKAVEKVTVKAAQGQTGLYTNARDVAEAIEKGTLSPTDSVFGVEGTKEVLDKALKRAYGKAAANGSAETAERLKSAMENLKVTEQGTTQSTRESAERLMEKIQSGQAGTSATLRQVGSKMAQGAVIGAAIGLTVSAVSNYIRYKNGELTEAEAFREIGQGTANGLLTGSAMGGVSLFLPAGLLGFVGGIAIGIYVNAACGNLLDEIFGKGVFGAILDASGYLHGSAVRLEKCIGKIARDEKQTTRDMTRTRSVISAIDETLDEFDAIMKG
jgi:polyhydroxyalkanoate synthesis regulator phasin